MTQKEIIQLLSTEVRERFKNEWTGHDWWHIYRVWKLATKIAEKEAANLFIVELAALLHDIADWKFNNGDESAGGCEARKTLERFAIDTSIINEVVDIVNTISYKGAGVETKMKSIEGEIVQDADRLDAIGAIGIARTFAYGGSKGRPMYDPKIKPVLHHSFEAYKTSNAPTINHFHEKLLLLKYRMNTKTGNLMAHDRHLFMENFLAQFHKEWDVD